ncbi:MAG: hypothetical protein AAF555_10230 [Verrucomicrobiota bacterium]
MPPHPTLLLRLVAALLGGGLGSQAAAAESPPRETVQQFFTALRNPDQALPLQENPLFRISPFCPPEKISEYQSSLDSFRRETLAGDWRFQIEQERADGRFAVLLASLRSPRRPLEVRLLSLCLLRKKERWQLAPGLSHYQNADYGFGAEASRRVRDLESWATDRSGALQAQLEATAERSLWDRLEKKVAAHGAAFFSAPEKVLQAYLEASQAGDLLEMLALIDLPPDALPAEKRELIRLLSSSASLPEEALLPGGAPAKVYQTLLASQTRGSQQVTAVGHYAPLRQRSLEVHSHYLQEREGAWRVMPLSQVSAIPFADAWEIEEELLDWIERQDRRLEQDFVSWLHAQAGKVAAPRARPFAEQLLRDFRQHLLTGDLLGALALVRPSADRSPFEQKHTLTVIGDLIARYAGRESFRLFHIEEEGDLATGFFCYFQAKDLADPYLESLFAVRLENGWQLLPSMDELDLPKELENPERQRSGQELRHFQRRQQELLRTRARASFLADLPRVATAAGPTPPSAEEARALFRRFHEAARARDLTALLAQCAILPDLEASELKDALLGLQAALRDRENSNQSYQVLEVKTAGGWSGLLVELDHPGEEAPLQKLWLATRCGESVRLLLQGEFFPDSNPGYQAINRDLLQTLSRLPETDRAAISQLRTWHQKQQKNPPQD